MAGPGIERGYGRQTLTIAISTTTSGVFEAKRFAAFGVALPATFTGTTLTFTVSADNVTFQALSDSTGTAVSMTVAQGKSYDLPAALAAWPFFKIVSGSSEGAARDLLVVAKG